MQKAIKLEHRDLIVKKLPLGKYAELLKALEKLPQELNSLSNLDNEQLLPRIPVVIGECFPDVIKLFTIATDLTEEECQEKIGLDEAVEVFVAIYEVNNYKAIFDKVKKIFSSQTVAKLAQKKMTGTGGL